MNPNQNFSPSNISVIVRLRGPKNKNNNISNNIPNNPNEKPIMKTLKKTISSQKNNSKDKSKNIINKKIKNIGLDLNTKYTIFTCRQPSKTNENNQNDDKISEIKSINKDLIEKEKEKEKEKEEKQSEINKKYGRYIKKNFREKRII